MNRPLKIGNAQGFWGDQPNAAREMLRACPDMDYLTLDYLAEVSMSIMAVQRERHPELGFAKDFSQVVNAACEHWAAGGLVKLVTNAGGLNPKGCAEACIEVLKEQGISKKVAVVAGDDVMAILSEGVELNHIETGEPCRREYQTANAYMGADGIVEALENGADIVITGRVADPSLTVGPCRYHFGWKEDDWDRLAAAVVAGHLIECGTQVTGGCLTDWLETSGDHGFPYVIMEESGDFVISKPKGTGGEVSIRSVKEQLLYEVGDPDHFITPDVEVSLMGVKLLDDGGDRVCVSGARGRERPDKLKVNATWHEGYKAEGMLTVVGDQAARKARHSGAMIIERLSAQGLAPEHYVVEAIGAGDVGGGITKPSCEIKECVLRIAVSSPDRKPCLAFSKELASLVTCGAQGVTGYSAGRPRVRSVYGCWPALIDRELCKLEVEVLG